MYTTHFDHNHIDAFHYVIVGADFFSSPSSGVSWYDTILIDDSKWWIDGRVRPQAGTLLHELGHQFGLNSDLYDKIDTVGPTRYDSVMNYLYQATKIDYSDSDSDGTGGRDFDDWAHVRVDRARGDFTSASKSAGDDECR